ncbi:hypothetical protein [Ktedonobacter racemifer]|uniref:Uncharacterized protein n=1 Tax=Ktedonobacter racemifer DSM 44963 TaxID=485913 RepID=D6TJ57_KTERA|nr:hypothetical protein [Ktedonobacter racemifer]EFH89464.1 hypothetical protein Krac_11022 [Ktedonobacter racemifer DSM 44963]
MEEKTSTTNKVAMEPAKEQQKVSTKPEIAGNEPRKAYGTAKTENLQDSGLWRILLPAFVAACCILLFFIPLGILSPLVLQAIDPSSPTGPHGLNLIWLWIGMAVIELGIAIVIFLGFRKIFFTQAGNYRP